MDMEAQADPRQGVGVRHRLECLVKAISVCHKCDLESGPVRHDFVIILTGSKANGHHHSVRLLHKGKARLTMECNVDALE